ncbi:DUF397 domain-containing protein [Streptomyces sp. NPDC048636]|uniref:DUF397 domain-containing protein n=1 Tax=Streptomyces sp. NPDC048636 TaxID=3155762 RepID=UPI00344188F5
MHGSGREPVTRTHRLPLCATALPISSEITSVAGSARSADQGPAGGALRYTAAEWDAFRKGVLSGEL